MRLEQERPSDEIEDLRSPRGGFGSPRGSGGLGGGRGLALALGSGRFSFSTIIILLLIYFGAKMLLGIDLLDILNQGGGVATGSRTGTEYTIPDGGTDVTNSGDTGGGVGTTDVTKDAGKDFVARVLGSTER